jgi:large subunit ribosomal protein L6
MQQFLRMEKKGTKQKSIVEEINLPEKVTASLDKGVLTIKGPKGEVKRDISTKKVKFEAKEKTIVLDAGKSNKIKKKTVKSYAAHIRNMIKGSSEGHKYTLKICSGHFPMNVSISNNEFIVKNFLGEKVPRALKIKEGAKVKVEGNEVVVESQSKEIAGQVSADIEQLTRRTNYDARIFQDGIYIINKDGKEIK